MVLLIIMYNTVDHYDVYRFIKELYGIVDNFCVQD